MIRVLNPAYPEGVFLAILFMNVMAPIIDHYIIQANINRRLKRLKNSIIMALNKESNGFTFGFAIVLVVALGVILAALAEGLKPRKLGNIRVKKQIDILSAMMDVEKEGIDRTNADKVFADYVDLKKAVILNNLGNQFRQEKRHSR